MFWSCCVVPRHAQGIDIPGDGKLLPKLPSQLLLSHSFLSTLSSKLPLLWSYQPFWFSGLWSCLFHLLSCNFWSSRCQHSHWDGRISYPAAKLSLYTRKSTVDFSYSWETSPTLWTWWKSLTLMRLSVLALAEKLDVVLPTMGIVISREFFIKVQQMINAKEMTCFSLYDLQFIDIMAVVYWKWRCFHFFCDFCHSTWLQ